MNDHDLVDCLNPKSLPDTLALEQVGHNQQHDWRELAIPAIGAGCTDDSWPALRGKAFPGKGEIKAFHSCWNLLCLAG